MRVRVHSCGDFEQNIEVEVLMIIADYHKPNAHFNFICDNGRSLSPVVDEEVDVIDPSLDGYLFDRDEKAGYSSRIMHPVFHLMWSDYEKLLDGNAEYMTKLRKLLNSSMR